MSWWFLTHCDKLLMFQLCSTKCNHCLFVKSAHIGFCGILACWNFATFSCGLHEEDIFGVSHRNKSLLWFACFSDHYLCSRLEGFDGGQGWLQCNCGFTINWVQQKVGETTIVFVACLILHSSIDVALVWWFFTSPEKQNRRFDGGQGVLKSKLHSLLCGKYVACVSWNWGTTKVSWETGIALQTLCRTDQWQH